MKLTLSIPVKRDPRAMDGADDAGTGAAGDGTALGDVNAGVGAAAAGAGDGAAAAAAAGAGAGAAAGAGDAGAQGLQIPEKFQVRKGDGSLDLEKSAEKMLASYTHLEKRFRDNDVPPESSDKYVLDKYLPEGMTADPEREKAVLKVFHKEGLTQKQVMGVMKVYGDLVAEATTADATTKAEAVKGLKTEWGADFDANINLARVAARTLLDPAERELVMSPKYGNDPVVLKLLAAAGREISKEDTSVHGGGAIDRDTLDQLRAHPAYLDSKHPEHKSIVAKVNAMYQGGRR